MGLRQSKKTGIVDHSNVLCAWSCAGQRGHTGHVPHPQDSLQSESSARSMMDHCQRHLCSSSYTLQSATLPGVCYYLHGVHRKGFPAGSVVKNPPAMQESQEMQVPAFGRSPGGGHGNPLQYSCLENPMDRGAWWATVHRVAKR